MNTLIAVIDDLWQFAWQNLSGVRTLSLVDEEKEIQATLPLTLATKSKPTFDTKLDWLMRAGEQYYVGDLDTFLYSDPVIAFDTAIEKISYGQSVYVKKLGGRWAEVTVSGRPGWILKDSLREKREDIHPQFVINHTYYADDKETEKLRACIGDEFAGARAGLPLAPAEFVTYQLSQRKRFINWPKDGPRVAGTWQKRLRGQVGIHITIVPTTGSVMEYILEDTGYLAYVEAVFPDQSIKLLQIGIPEEGQYTERMMSKEEYRELRPVFIEVS